jgi:hypothetical protein
MAKTKLMKNIDLQLTILRNHIEIMGGQLDGGGLLKGGARQNPAGMVLSESSVKYEKQQANIMQDHVESLRSTTIPNLEAAVEALGKRTLTWYKSSGSRLKDMFTYKMFKKKRQRAREFYLHMDSTLAKFKAEAANFDWSTIIKEKSGNKVLEEIPRLIAVWRKLTSIYNEFGRSESFQAKIDQGIADIESTAKSTEAIKDKK